MGEGCRGNEEELGRAVGRVLDDQGDVTDEYYAVVQHIFARFGPADGARWALEHFNAMLAASGEPHATSADWDHLGELFVDDWAGLLPLASFTAMALVSAEEDPDAECAQMVRLGYPIDRAAFPPPPDPDDS